MTNAVYYIKDVNAEKGSDFSAICYTEVTDSNRNIRLQQAFEDWRWLLGDNSVSLANSEPNPYSGCEAHCQSALATLRPKTTVEVQEIVKIANKYQISLFPYSRGRNWGYGSSSPVAANNVVVDLSLLNRIIKVDDELAYAVIEPGVTQEQLYNYLRDNNLSLAMDVTAAPPDASVLGNMLERGFGYTPYGDRFQSVASLEIVLPDSSIIKTGFGHFATETASLYSWGLGPSLNGLFSQSNFGIITKASIWLRRQTESYAAYIATIETDEELFSAVERIRDLKLEGKLIGIPHIINDIRALALATHFPENERREFSLPEATILELRKRHKISNWTLVGGIWGSAQQIQLSFAELNLELSPLCNLKLLGPVSYKESLSPENSTKENLLFSLISGTPSKAAIRGMYWRKSVDSNSADLDPIKDGVGLHWCSPVIPLRRRDVALALKIVREHCAEHGFESNIALVLAAERACIATIAISFDRSIEAECIRASICSRVLTKALAAAGYFPYRYGTDVEALQETLFSNKDPFWNFCNQIKKCVDPNHILAPGKYGIW